MNKKYIFSFIFVFSALSSTALFSCPVQTLVAFTETTDAQAVRTTLTCHGLAGTFLVAMKYTSLCDNCVTYSGARGVTPITDQNEAKALFDILLRRMNSQKK